MSRQAAAEQVGAFAEVVADVDRGDLLDQVAVHLVEVHQLGEQPAHGLRARLGGQQLHLGAGVVQHVRGDRMTFGLVGVQQGLRRPAADLGGQLPAEVERVLDAEVEALSAGGRMDVRRIAGQQHPPDPIALGQPGGIAEAGHPARGVHAEVGPGDGAQLLPEVLEGGRFRAVADARGGDDDADRPRRRAGRSQNRRSVSPSPATVAAISSGGTPTSISPISVSVREGSPGKPTPSSLRTVLRPPSQPTR